MFEQVLPGNTRAVLAVLSESEFIRQSCLGGGTALALQLGHRISRDLDFFTAVEFDEHLMLPHLEELADFHLEKITWRTIRGRFGDVLFSIFHYDYPLLFSPLKFGKIRVIETRDIAAMKLAAIAARGAKRDFFDLYFVCREVAPLPELIRLYDDKYHNLASDAIHLVKSLGYFDDAEEEETPDLLKEVSWEEVKTFFRREVDGISRELLL